MKKKNLGLTILPALQLNFLYLFSLLSLVFISVRITLHGALTKPQTQARDRAGRMGFGPRHLLSRQVNTCSSGIFHHSCMRLARITYRGLPREDSPAMAHERISEPVSHRCGGTGHQLLSLSKGTESLGLKVQSTTQETELQECKATFVLG